MQASQRSRKRSHRADVMVSSTTLDLAEHRKAAIDAIWRRGMFALAMEGKPASSTDAIKFSLEMVDEAEVYIGIFGFRYGYRPKDRARNPQHLSITELEYRRASSRGIPILIFFMADDHPRPDADETQKPMKPEGAEAAKKLQRLKQELRSKYFINEFRSPQELAMQVYSALTELREQKLIRLEADVTPEDDTQQRRAASKRYSIHDYFLTRKFFGRRKELAMLDTWKASSDTTMLIEAIGGAGKSALAWEWYLRRGEEFDGAMWWSFYESDSHISTFTRHALSFVTGRPLKEFERMSYAERERLLLQELRQKHYLFVFDGVERILVAYHRMDAPHMADDKVDERLRACADPRHGELLRKLVRGTPSKLLITTRLIPTDLQDAAGRLLPGVRSHQLEGLDPDDAVTLIRHLGIKGDARDLKPFLKQFGYHSLLISVLAGHIKNFRKAPGSFDAWYTENGRSLRLSSLDIKGRRTQILQYSFDGLKPELSKFLSQVAAFRYPIDYETISLFNPHLPASAVKLTVNPPDEKRLDELYEQLRTQFRTDLRDRLIKEIAAEEARIARAKAEYEEKRAQADSYQKLLKESRAQEYFDAGLAELENRGLLMWDRRSNHYDLHPIVRAYAFEHLPEPEQRQTFQAIRDHFERMPPENLDEVQELWQMRRSLEIYYALVHAGEYNQASRFYSNQLRSVLQERLAAYDAVVELLEPLFPQGIDYPPALDNPGDRKDRMSDLANTYYLRGQVRNAVRLHYQIMARNLDQAMSPQANGAATASRSSKDNPDRDNTSKVIESLHNYLLCMCSVNRLSEALRAAQLSHELATALRHRPSQMAADVSLLYIYKIIGLWNEAEALYQNLHVDENDRNSRALWIDALCYYAEMQLYRGISTLQTIEMASNQAKARFQNVSVRLLSWLRGEIALQQQDPDEAVHQFQEAITMAQKSGAGEVGQYYGGLARAYAMQRRYKDTLDVLRRGVPNIDVAEALYSLGNPVRAKRYALKAYEFAWAQGPLYTRKWELTRARALLENLHVSEPQLPEFHSSMTKPMPHEDRIQALITRLKQR